MYSMGKIVHEARKFLPTFSAILGALTLGKISEHGSETDLIHVGFIYAYLWRGLLCRDSSRYKFVHGLAVTVKSIEHQY